MLTQLDAARDQLLERQRALEGQLSRIALNRRDLERGYEAVLDELREVERDLAASGIHHGSHKE